MIFGQFTPRSVTSARCGGAQIAQIQPSHRKLEKENARFKGKMNLFRTSIGPVSPSRVSLGSCTFQWWEMEAGEKKERGAG